MAKIVSFMEFRYRETIAVLRSVLRRALRGEVEGLALCILTDEGDQFAFTGKFKQDSASALKAANRISWKMNQALDDLESAFGPP
jgi:hypothetical protein